MVINAGLSGLEPCVLSPQEMAKLETQYMSLARKTLGWESWQNEARRHNNTTVLTKMRLWTFSSYLRRQRLRWWHSMAKRPSHHRFVFASVFGRFDWETVYDLSADFYPADAAHPYLKQLANDLEQGWPQFSGFHATWIYDFARTDVDDLDRVLVRKIPQSSTTIPITSLPGFDTGNPDEPFLEDVTGMQFRCDLCPKIFPDRPKLGIHRRREHKVLPPSAFIVANQCPRCTMPFATAYAAGKHWERDQCHTANARRGKHNNLVPVVVRLKTALAHGLTPAGIVPVNFDVPLDLARQRAGAAADQETPH